MVIKDIVYGKIEYSEPIILELIKSKSVKRLKNISQFGIPDKYYFKKNFKRYDHCVGAMNLLHILGAPIEEQVAGLLHDVSQFSFSHISDWVFGEGHKGNESYHDTHHNNFILKTEIPKILKKYRYSVKRILNEDNFPLLENHSPDICADRIDYALRELAYSGKKNIVSNIINNLTNLDNKIVFLNADSAALFSNAFLDLQTKHWGSKEAIVRYSLFSKAFKIAVSENLIKHDDFWDKSEEELTKILEKSGNLDILNILKKLEKGNLSEKTGNRVFKKFRYVDPFVIIGNKLIKVSKIDDKYNKRLKKAKHKNSLGVLV